jgi:hypothetical protein
VPVARFVHEYTLLARLVLSLEGLDLPFAVCEWSRSCFDATLNDQKKSRQICEEFQVLEVGVRGLLILTSTFNVRISLDKPLLRRSCPILLVCHLESVKITSGSPYSLLR